MFGKSGFGWGGGLEEPRRVQKRTLETKMHGLRESRLWKRTQCSENAQGMTGLTLVSTNGNPAKGSPDR